MSTYSRHLSKQPPVTRGSLIDANQGVLDVPRCNLRPTQPRRCDMWEEPSLAYLCISTLMLIFYVLFFGYLSHWL